MMKMNSGILWTDIVHHPSYFFLMTSTYACFMDYNSNHTAQTVKNPSTISKFKELIEYFAWDTVLDLADLQQAYTLFTSQISKINNFAFREKRKFCKSHRNQINSW